MSSTCTVLAFRQGESKSKTIARMKGHIKADQLVHGQYWGNGKGCAVACMVHKSSGCHAEFPRRWGIPEEIARLEDGIFERLQNGDSQKWPIQFLEAIPDGADLSMAWPRFALRLLTDKDSPIQAGLGKRAAVDKAVADVVELYREWIDTAAKPEVERWRAKRSAAYAAYAAAYAAYAAAAADAAAADDMNSAYASGASSASASRERLVKAARRAIPLLRCLPHLDDPTCPSCEVVAELRAALAEEGA
jgi:hypothetical protein